MPTPSPNGYFSVPSLFGDINDWGDDIISNWNTLDGYIFSLFSQHRGATRPADLEIGGVWNSSASNIYYVYDGAEDISLFSFNATTNIATWLGSLPDNSVITAKIADGAVTQAKLGADVQLIPAGAVMPFAMSSAPTGWLKADGSAVSRTTYAALFTAIGTQFGSGDGSTTFNLPDLRAEFIRGLDDGRGVDTGRVLGSAQEDLIENHTHSGTTESDGNHHHAVNASLTSGDIRILGSQTNSFAGFQNVGSGINWYKNNTNMRNEGAHTHSFTTGNPNSALGGAETRPRNVALLYCIKT